MNDAFGIRRAVIERARRRGYYAAATDALNALAGKVPPPARKALRDWQKDVTAWQRGACLGGELDCEPPRLVV